MEIGFSYGACCDPLEKQANEIGLTLGEESEKFEGLRKAILLLVLNGIMSNADANKCCKKLHKQVVKKLVIVER